MKPTVYVETTIPSYYCDSRPELAGDIARTHEWWNDERAQYECFVSAVVFDELSQGEYPTKSRCLKLVKGLPLLAVTAEIEAIAMAYCSHKLMPLPPVRDALHLAIASYYRLDYVLTWNCVHLANANKATHLDVLNAQLRLGLPRLVTPHQLRLWEADA